MRTIVAFLIESDDTTDEVSDFIEDACGAFGPGTVVDHEVRVDVNPDEDHLDRLLASITWDERAQLEGQRELDPIFDKAFARCGHFDAMADPNHDCSDWS